jgi:nucleoside-diphosphate-sugar epimerase
LFVFHDHAITLINVYTSGTENIINVCKEENVPYFIYCGSSGIFNGPEEVKAGTETTVQSPSKLYFESYASTKGKAQTIALSANGDKLKNGEFR